MVITKNSGTWQVNNFPSTKTQEIFIVAGNYEQFVEYTSRKKGDGNFYCYVRDRTTLLGLSEVKGFYIGTWRDRPDIEEITHAIAVIKAKSKTHNKLPTP